MEIPNAYLSEAMGGTRDLRRDDEVHPRLTMFRFRKGPTNGSPCFASPALAILGTNYRRSWPCRQDQGLDTGRDRSRESYSSLHPEKSAFHAEHGYTRRFCCCFCACRSQRIRRSHPCHPDRRRDVFLGRGEEEQTRSLEVLPRSCVSTAAGSRDVEGGRTARVM